MADKNTKIILKSTDLVFKGNKYKLNHELVPSKFNESLSPRDRQILKMKGEKENIATVYFSGDYINVTPISITEANNLADIETIILLRNPSQTRISLPYIEGSEDTLVERIPMHYHISETLDMYYVAKMSL